MTKPLLVIAEPDGVSETALRMVSDVMALRTGPYSRQALHNEIAEATGILIRLGHRIDADLLAAANNLRFIASPTTGLNHVDLEAANRAGVEILSLKGERGFLDDIHATAEHSWALLLSLLRRIPWAQRSVLSGEWNRDAYRGGELHGKTLGVVGYGRLGSKVANYGRAFGMRVVATDPVAEFPDWVDSADLDAVAEQADVLSVHVDFNQRTRNLISGEVLGRIKPGCLIINTSRGEVIDEAALLSGLASGRVGGAALDVLCFENDGGQALNNADLLRDYARSHENLIITPHIGGATFESMAKTEVFIAKKIVQFMRRPKLL